MHVRIVETRDDGSSVSVNYPCLWATQPQNFFILAHSGYLSGRYGYGFDKRGHRVRGDLGVVQYELSRHSSSPFQVFPKGIEKGGGNSAR
jgi:hypothetical protein